MSSGFHNSRSRQLVQELLLWYRRHRRNLPWRANRNPYRIWVSEIMLQQTRVTTVLPYYKHFLERFPTVETLARAPDQELLECWSGLGYYRRVRQMQLAARQILQEFKGEFPSTYEGLRTLPGIGPYTAAAIASISFGQARAVLDGNVVRVLTRLFNDPGDVGKSVVRGRLQQRAQELLQLAGPRSAGKFNQALMELGATLCTPRNPQCLLCPAAAHCRARKKGVQEQRPVRPKKERTVRLQLAVALVQRGSGLLMWQRPEQYSVMPGFWELPEVEGRRLGKECFRDFGIARGQRLGEFRHGITFRDYLGSVYRGTLQGEPPDGYRWISERRLQTLPLTTITRKALSVVRQAGPQELAKKTQPFVKA